MKALLAVLEDTEYELVIGAAEWKIHVKDIGSKVPLFCTTCRVERTPTIKNFTRFLKSDCQCSTHCRWNTQEKFDELVQMLSTRGYELAGEWTDFEYFKRHAMALKPISTRCRSCDRVNHVTVINSISNGCSPACNCPKRSVRESDWCSEPGKKRLDEIIIESRFEWKDSSTRHDAIVGDQTRVALVCTVCCEEATPTIDKLVHGRVGCGCNNSTELKTLQFARAVCEQRFPERNLVVVHKHRDPALRGLGGHPLERDISVFERVDDHLVPLLFLEIDGGHHFNPNHRYGTGDERGRHTFEHDVLKEEHALNQKASMARLEQRTVEADKAGWKAWLQGKIEAAVNRELPNHIYRLSAGQHYVGGEYAARRKGLRINPELPAGQPFVATGILVDVLPMPQPVQQIQPTIQHGM